MEKELKIWIRLLGFAFVAALLIITIAVTVLSWQESFNKEPTSMLVNLEDLLIYDIKARATTLGHPITMNGEGLLRQTIRQYIDSKGEYESTNLINFREKLLSSCEEACMQADHRNTTPLDLEILDSILNHSLQLSTIQTVIK